MNQGDARMSCSSWSASTSRMFFESYPQLSYAEVVRTVSGCAALVCLVASHTGRLPLSPWAVGEQLLNATLVEVGDVHPRAVQSPLEFISFAQKLVPLGEKVLVLQT